MLSKYSTSLSPTALITNCVALVLHYAGARMLAGVWFLGSVALLLCILRIASLFCHGYKSGGKAEGIIFLPIGISFWLLLIQRESLASINWLLDVGSVACFVLACLAQLLFGRGRSPQSTES